MIKKIIVQLTICFICLYCYAENCNKLNIQKVKAFFNENKYIYNFLFDVAKSEDKDTIHNFSDLYEDFKYEEMEHVVIFNWDLNFRINPINIFTNKFNDETIDIGENYLTIDYIKRKGNDIIIYCDEFDKTDRTLSPLNWELIKKFDKISFVFTFNGDYLDIYVNEKKSENFFATFCKATDETCNEIESLIKKDVININKITWPHHADGTSEYEDTIRYPEPVVIEEPEEIEISEEQEEQSKPESNYYELLKQNDPERYEEVIRNLREIERKEKIETIVKISIIILSIVIVLTTAIIILKKKKKSAK